MPDTLDAPAVRAWCRLALDALGQAREEIDAINVYPVPDGDTGTNLYLTVESATQAVEAVFNGHTVTGRLPAFADAVRAMAHGALIGARGNSGVILAQLLRGLTEVVTAGLGPCDAGRLRLALRRAAESAYEAVARPVEGTVLTVAAAAARAAERAEGGLAAVARAAHAGARSALAETPRQLAVLGAAGVVDAGGRGLVSVLGALADAVTGDRPLGPLAVSDPVAPLPPLAGCQRGAASFRAALHIPEGTPPGPSPYLRWGDPQAGLPERAGAAGGAFEVVYLLNAPDPAVPALRARLDQLGDSLVMVGGEGLWKVHVHVDDAGAAVEAGVEAGRPHRIRITHLGGAALPAEGEPAQLPHLVRAVVAVVEGAGLARLCAEAGAIPLRVPPGVQPASGDIAAKIAAARAREVVLLPNDPQLRAVAGVAAEQARAGGVRVALIPTRSVVQGIAALAVHEPSRSFDEDVVAMTAAAGATRHAELAVAEAQSWTMAGMCFSGDVLGLIDGDVAVIGSDLVETGVAVLDRMLAAGGEMVTLVLGENAPDELGDRLEAHVRRGHVAVDTVVYRGGQHTPLLVIGVE